MLSSQVSNQHQFHFKHLLWLDFKICGVQLYVVDSCPMNLPITYHGLMKLNRVYSVLVATSVLSRNLDLNEDL